MALEIKWLANHDSEERHDTYILLDQQYPKHLVTQSHHQSHIVCGKNLKRKFNEEKLILLPSIVGSYSSIK